MRIAVDSAVLARALSFSVARENITLEALKQVRLRSANEAVLIDSTDLSLYATTSIPARIDEPGEILLNASLLAAASSGQGELIVSDKGVTRGRSKLRVPASNDVDGFPALDHGKIVPLALDPLRFADALDAIAFAAAPEDSPHHFARGVHVTPGVASAVNGYVVATIDIDYDGPGFIIPTAALKRVRKLLGENAVMELGLVNDKPANLRIRNGEDRLAVALLDVKPMPFREWFPEEWPAPLAVIDASATKSALHRLSAFLPCTARGEFQPVRLVLSDESRIEDRSGENVESIEAKSSVTEEFGVDIRLLSLVLDNAPTSNIEVTRHNGRQVVTLFRPVGEVTGNPRYVLAGANV